MLSAIDKYESSNFTYFPTIAIFTFSSFKFLIFLINSSQLKLLGISLNFNFSHILLANPSFSSINGTSYKFSTVLFCITSCFLTLQNNAIFCFKFSSISCSALQTNMSGFIPIDCNSFTEC